MHLSLTALFNPKFKGRVCVPVCDVVTSLPQINRLLRRSLRQVTRVCTLRLASHSQVSSASLALVSLFSNLQSVFLSFSLCPDIRVPRSSRCSTHSRSLVRSSSNTDRVLKRASRAIECRSRCASTLASGLEDETLASRDPCNT